MTSSHTLHVHRAGTVGNQTAIYADHIDRWYARQLRWSYRVLRRHGVSSVTARMVVLNAFYAGGAAGGKRAYQRMTERSAA